MQGRFDPIFERDRMQAVQAQQALDELVFAETREHGFRPIAELLVHDRENAFETVAVDRDDGSNELLRPLAGLARRLFRVEPREQFRDPVAIPTIDLYPNGASGEWTVSMRLVVSQIHVHAARQARIEAAHGAHDVDALE